MDKDKNTAATEPQKQAYQPLIFSEEIEKRVILAILCNNNCYYAASSLLSPDMFYNAKNARLYKVIQDGVSNGKIVDTMYCAMYSAQHPDKNGYAVNDIMAEFSGYVSGAMFSQDVESLRSLAQRRKIWTLGAKLTRIGRDMSYTVDSAMSDINNLLDNGDSASNGVITMRDANIELRKHVEENIKGECPSSLHTGFRDIDDNGGFQLTDFNVIAADSSMGKTSLAMNIAESVASNGKPVMIYSMEMMSWQLAARINSHTAHTPVNIIMFHKLARIQECDLDNAMSVTDNLPIYFDDKSTTSAEAIMASIRLNARRLDVKLFVVDYLQILSTVGSVQNTETFLGEASRKFKNLAKELSVNITVLSQLARNPQDPRPTLSRVRASGQIVEAADMVLLIWRPERYGKTSYKDSKAPTFNTAEIIVAKGRNVGRSSFVVHFDPKTTFFYDPTEEEREAWSTSSFVFTSKNDDKDTRSNNDPLSPPPPLEPKQQNLPF